MTKLELQELKTLQSSLIQECNDRLLKKYKNENESLMILKEKMRTFMQKEFLTPSSTTYISLQTVYEKKVLNYNDT